MARIVAQAVAAKQAVQVPDLVAYGDDDPLMRLFAGTTGARSLILVPLLNKGEVIGTSAIYRQEVRPFTDKQVELLNEFRRASGHRHREYAAADRIARRSLEQQTATSDVLPGHIEFVGRTGSRFHGHLGQCDADLPGKLRHVVLARRRSVTCRRAPWLVEQGLGRAVAARNAACAGS